MKTFELYRGNQKELHAVKDIEKLAYKLLCDREELFDFWNSEKLEDKLDILAKDYSGWRAVE